MEENRHFLNKKVSVWHIVYICIICLIVNVFLLVIVPGRVSDDAYQNFSFAATVTSIVLAVVSIVYSLQSGLSSIGQLSSIKEIEGNISEEISKFSGIEETIRQALTPLSNKMGDLQKTQDTFSERVSELSTKFEQAESTNSTETTQRILGSEIMYVTLYAALKSHETGMDMPYHIFAKFVGGQAKYCEGLIDGLAAICPDEINVEQGSKSSRKKVDKFNTERLGDQEYLSQKISEIKDKKLSESLKISIDNYFRDIANQSSDSVSA